MLVHGENDSDVPIAVERTMYWTALGVAMRGGTNEVGVRLK